MMYLLFGVSTCRGEFSPNGDTAEVYNNNSGGDYTFVQEAMAQRNKQAVEIISLYAEDAATENVDQFKLDGKEVVTLELIKQAYEYAMEFVSPVFVYKSDPNLASWCTGEEGITVMIGEGSPLFTMLIGRNFDDLTDKEWDMLEKAVKDNENY